MLFLVLGAHAGTIENNALEATLPHEYVDAGIDKIVHCMAGIFISPFYALAYSIIYVLFDQGELTFSLVMSNFGKFFTKNLKD